MPIDFLLKIFKLEYYFDKPPDGSSVLYSELQGKVCTTLPVIRCFGSSPAGQKLCAHIHGVLPYLFIEYPVGDLDAGQMQRTLRSLAQRLNEAITAKLPRSPDDHLRVFDIRPLRAKSIYGYRGNLNTFLKIILVNPADIQVTGDLLLSGAALGSSFQPFESHIPYLLQFCADFNLQGMNYLQASKFRLRGTRTKADALSEPDIRLVDPLRFLWTENDGLLETQIHENCPERQTSTDVEVDISASDIMNNRDCNSNENINPGLDFLWAEERARRETIEELGVESVLTPVAAASLPKMPTPDGLLPLSGRPHAQLAESEGRLLKQFNKMCMEYNAATSTAPAKGAPAEEASPTGDLFYSQQSVNSSFTPSCGMSEQALDELCCLADLTEEADAPIHSQLLMSQLQETHFDLSSFLNASADAGSLIKQASSLPVFRQVSKSYQKTVLAGDSEVDTSWVTSDGPFCTLSPDRSAPTSPTTGDANLTEDTLVARATLAASQYARSARSALFVEQDADELLAAPNCPPVQPGTDSAADEFEDFEDLFGEADNEDHFPVDDPAVFRDPTSPTAADIVESTFADGTLISNLPRLPQLDGVDDDSIIPDQPGRRQHRRLGLRLSGRRLFPESPTDVGSLPTGTLSSTNDRFLSSPRVETQLSSKPAVDPKRRRLGMLSRTTVPPTVPILSLPPCRVVLQPLSGTDMVGISTNTCNSSFFMTVPVTVQGPSFPSTYNSQHASSPCVSDASPSCNLSWTFACTPSVCTSSRDTEVHSTPLNVKIPDPDFILHSSGFVAYKSIRPPSFSLVESQLADRKPTDEIRPISSQAKNPLEDSRVSDLDAKVDLSTSISDLWWSTLASRPRRLSAARNSTSRRALLPVQENHLCMASLEVLVRTRYRLRGEAEAPASRRMQVGRLVRETEAISLSRLGGYAPDPQLDAVLLACLCFQKPRAACELFVLLNRADAGALGTSESLLHRLLPSRRSNLPVTSRLLLCGGEMELLNWTACLVQSFDPDLLVGYDVERRSWGFLVERARKLGYLGFPRDISRLAADLLKCAVCRENVARCRSLLVGGSTVLHCEQNPCACHTSSPGKSSGAEHAKARQKDWPAEPGAGRTGGPFSCPGRVVLCLWRLIQHELSLHEYSFENVVYHVLKERVPRFVDGQLTFWFQDPNGVSSQQALEYWAYRCFTNLRLIAEFDLIGRSSEFARVFGIEFYHVFSRGSQYRVESLLLRTARRLNFLLPSPNVVQRARQRAPEALPLNLEPVSGLHADGPVVVLDFQSLYPSVAIAYNYCFSTCLGRLSSLEKGAGGESFNFGCLEHSVTPEDLKLVGDYVTVAPNGVCFVKRDILEGVLPRLWRGLLSSRLMVKDSMKLYIGDESLKRLLDARQLGLKLIANVIYGYTAASFSGRMPCVEVGDSIVHKGRETLERAIQLVETGFGVPPGTPTPWLTGGGCDAKVIYGDTDSLFVKLPHCDKATSFRLGQAMADAVSQANPAPIKLKLEKVFFPCILEAKKRYVGYAYESAEQATAVFDAKGIETVRRDSAPFVGKVLESSLRLLFDQFRIWDEPPDLARVELKIRAKVRNFATRLINGRIPFSSCILARAYLGQTGYRPGACAPALQVARRLMSVDANSEPLVGERVTYYIAPGKPSEALIGGVRAAQEAWPLIFFNEGERTVSCRRAPAPSLNLAFYLDHQLLPPIARFAELLGWNVQAWLHDLPRLLATSVTGSAMTASQTGHFPLQIRTTPLSAKDESSVCQSSQLLPHHTSTPCVTTRQRGWGRNQRPSSVLQTFLKRPKICPGCGFTVKMRTDPSGVTTQKTWGHCEQCLLLDPSLPVRSLIALGAEMNSLMTRLQLSERVCTACIGLRSPGPVSWCCSNLACANRDRRCQLIRDMGRVTSRFPTDFPSFETFSSWSPLPP